MVPYVYFNTLPAKYHDQDCGICLQSLNTPPEGSLNGRIFMHKTMKEEGYQCPLHEICAQLLIDDGKTKGKTNCPYCRAELKVPRNFFAIQILSDALVGMLYTLSFVALDTLAKNKFLTLDFMFPYVFPIGLFRSITIYPERTPLIASGIIGAKLFLKLSKAFGINSLGQSVLLCITIGGVLGPIIQVATTER